MTPVATPTDRWVTVSFSLLLLVNVALVGRVFLIPHATGDERLYVALAMKLDATGFREYNLYRVGLSVRDGFLEYRYAEPGRDDLLVMLAGEGTTFYDQPMFHQPPLFPYTMMLSHTLLSRDDPYRVLATSFAEKRLIERKTRLWNQLGVGLVPFVSALGLVVGCFYLGRILFGGTVGLLAALLLTTSPAYLLSAQRLWPDVTLAMFTTCGFVSCLPSAAGGRRFHLVIAGSVLGLALLVKNYAVVAVPLAVMTMLLCRMPSGAKATVINAVLLAGVSILIALPWYWAMARTFGNPFFAPSQPGISRTIEWFAELNALPWYTYFVGIPCQVPLFVLGYAGAGLALANLRKWDSPELVLSVWFIGWLVMLTWLTQRDELIGPEQRYMLPAYPALAVLAAAVLQRCRLAMARRTNALVANLIVVFLLACSILWSLRVGLRHLSSTDITLPL